MRTHRTVRAGVRTAADAAPPASAATGDPDGVRRPAHGNAAASARAGASYEHGAMRGAKATPPVGTPAGAGRAPGVRTHRTVRAGVRTAADAAPPASA
ncbi:hypothetical protein ACWC5C_40485, partial [Streptomyces sp. NPDC001700]